MTIPGDSTSQRRQPVVQARLQGDPVLGSAVLKLANPELDPLALPPGVQVRVPPLASVALVRALIAMGVLRLNPVTQTLELIPGAGSGHRG